MKKRLRNYGLLAMILIATMVIVSCTSYSYSLLTYNETTARVRGHELLGSVKLEVWPDEDMYERGIGVRALLIEKAKEEYGDDVDDVVNLAISQSIGIEYSNTTTFLIIHGDAIKYKEEK